MAKIFYVGIPAHGHTNPTLPVVRELIKRGHEVLYYNAASFRSKVSTTGVDFRAYPEPMPTERQLAEAMHELIDASVMLAEMSEHLTPFLMTEIEREQPDLIIYDSVAMWGYIAARTHHIPYICSITLFVLDGSQQAMGLGTLARFFWHSIPHIPKLLQWKRRMKQQYGNDVVGGITEYGDLNLVFTSKDFHPANNFIDSRFRFVGPSIDAATRDGEFPFEQLNGEKLVYISLGTINHLDLAFYRAAFTAFADYPAQFVLSAGKNTDIGQLGEIPSNFIVKSYVPQLALLQRADAFITHGGMNSVHEGLYYGVPEVVVPHQLEQLLNSKRVAETSAGIVLGNRYPYGRVTAKELREALDTVLNEPRYRQQARRIGDSLKAAGGYLQAAAEIEAFLGDKAQTPENILTPAG
ncbi:MAG: glycosyl transferase [Anaerolineaceae bacterium]|nr:glycosyl transferase [Anaerolineaceae bacterium]